MRLGIVAGSVLLLAGCAAIPPAVSVATWAIEGASLAFSGKSISDHAISAVTRKDCAMWRLLKGEPVCEDYPAENGPARAAVALLPAPPAKLDLASAPSPAIGAAPGVAIHLASFAPPPAPRPGAASGGTAPIIATTAPIEVTELRNDKPARLSPDAEAVAAQAALSPASGSGSGPTSGPTADRHFVAIGSYAVPANARRRVAQYDDLRPFIVAAVVDGRPLLRVAVGPFRSAELEAAMRRLRRAGVADAWVLPAGASLGPAPTIVADARGPGN